MNYNKLKMLIRIIKEINWIPLAQSRFHQASSFQNLSRFRSNFRSER